MGAAPPALACGAAREPNVAPRFRMTRRSPSRTSTVFRSFADINFTIRSSNPTSIGLSEDLPDARPLELVLGDFLFARLAKVVVLSRKSAFGKRQRAIASLDVAAFERLVQRREHFAAAVGDQHVVLDADASFAGDVDARLDGDDHARAELFVTARLAHGRQLVDLAADAVAEAVAEVVLEAGVVDHVAGDAVGLLRRDSGAQELDRRLLCLVNDLVNLLDLRTDAADHQRARQVRAV